MSQADYQAAYRETHREELRAKARAYAAAHAPAHRAKAKAWNAAHPERKHAFYRRWYLKKHYALTPEKVEEMTQGQGGRCAICQNEGRLVVDHNHKTGAVRELLCDPCNRTLGTLDESRMRLYAMVAYLDYWKQKCQ